MRLVLRIHFLQSHQFAVPNYFREHVMLFFVKEGECWTPRLVAFDNHRRFPEVVPDEMTNQLIGVTTWILLSWPLWCGHSVCSSQTVNINRESSLSPGAGKPMHNNTLLFDGQILTLNMEDSDGTPEKAEKITQTVVRVKCHMQGEMLN